MLGVVPVLTNQLVGIDVCLFNTKASTMSPAKSSAPRWASAWRIKGLACRQTRAGPHGMRLNQRVTWLWLSAPSSSRDKPVAVVGLVEFSK